mmetsp:Transcript_46381/g.98916  ORF Transcript_46381/g.98916 Transcript_46381/m.98916 type:complete len:110 (-) Transcript_46381:66-395(-)
MHGGRSHAGVGQAGGANPHRGGEHRLDERVETRARKRQFEMLGAVHVGRDEGQRHVRREGGAELRLDSLSRLVQPMQRKVVFSQVDGVRLSELLHEVLDERGVDGLTAR